jgi:c-di-AMP phosphodiesterase-like protein
LLDRLDSHIFPSSRPVAAVTIILIIITIITIINMTVIIISAIITTTMVVITGMIVTPLCLQQRQSWVLYQSLYSLEVQSKKMRTDRWTKFRVGVMEKTGSRSRRKQKWANVSTAKTGGS